MFSFVVFRFLGFGFGFGIRKAVKILLEDDLSRFRLINLTILNAIFFEDKL